MIAIVLMIYGAVFGFLYGVASCALPFIPDLSLLTSTGTGLVFGLVAGLLMASLRFVFALANIALAIVVLLAPFASWVISLIADPLGRRARLSRSVRERARIDAIYPPPHHPERRRHAET
jgi:hypothetical protein